MSRRDLRLANNKEFARVLAAGTRVSGELVKVNYAMGNRQARMGMAVSKKMTRTSVQRNRVRRAFFETFRSKAADLEGVELVVRLRRPCFNAVQARSAGADFALLLDKIAGWARQ